jgi:hypothetical protein
VNFKLRALNGSALSNKGVVQISCKTNGHPPCSLSRRIPARLERRRDHLRPRSLALTAGRDGVNCSIMLSHSSVN